MGFNKIDNNTIPKKNMIKKNKKIVSWLILTVGICGMATGIVLLVIISVLSVDMLPEDTSLQPLVIAMMLDLAVSIMFLIFGICFVKYLPKYASKYSSRHIRKKNEAYRTYLWQKITDYACELDKVRDSFAADNDPQKNMITYREKEKLGAKIQFMSAAAIAQYNALDYKPLYDYRTIEFGTIYYGCLLQANFKLFQKKKLSDLNEYPACILYSKDPYFEKNPLELVPIARNLFANKENNVLKNELEYKYHLEVPKEITGDRKVYMSTVMIDRTLLPMSGLWASIFPIIAAPEQSKSVFIVDDKFWTKNLITNYMYNTFIVHDGAEMIFGKLDSYSNGR